MTSHFVFPNSKGLLARESFKLPRQGIGSPELYWLSFMFHVFSA